MKVNYFILLVVIVVIALFPLVSSTYFNTHDGDLHLARIGHYYSALKQWQFPVRWGSELNNGFGHPVFIFMYPLPSYLGAVIHAIGFNLVNTFKIISLLSYIFSSITMFIFLKYLLRRESAAFIGALIYSFSPYRFLDVYVRGDLGEQMAFVFIPLVFLFIYKSKKNYLYAIIGGIFYALLILSHNGFGLIFTPVLIGFFLLNINNSKEFIKGVVLFAFGLALSSFFWLPALWESKYIQARILISNMYSNHFPSLLSLVLPTWGFGPDVNSSGGLSPQIGLVNIILFFSCLFLVLRKQRERNSTVIYFLLVFIVAVFLTARLSEIIWRIIPFMSYLQFPWRFTGVTVLASSIFGGYLISKVKRKEIILLLAFIIVISSIPFIRIQPKLPKSENYYLNFSLDTTWNGETNTIWVERNISKKAKSQIELIGGKGKIYNFDRKPTEHRFSITGKTETQILDNTIYFPGWQIFIDGRKTPIEFQDMNHKGLITFRIPKGNHQIIIKFNESPVRKLSDSLSLTAFIFVIIYLLFWEKLKLKLR